MSKITFYHSSVCCYGLTVLIWALSSQNVFAGRRSPYFGVGGGSSPRIQIQEHQLYPRRKLKPLYSLSFASHNHHRDEEDDDDESPPFLESSLMMTTHQIRAGSSSSDSNNNNYNYLDDLNRALTIAEQCLKVVVETATTIGIVVLPPLTFTIRNIYKFYKALPQDAILAQVGLVYCFAGGYFPTLFAAIQAAQHSGLQTMAGAVSDLVNEAMKAIDAAVNADGYINPSTTATKAGGSFWGSSNTRPMSELTPRQRFGRKTRIVLATVDPGKINTAVAALYTTWLGIEVCLQKEFAKTITLAVTVAEYIHPAANFLLGPPLRLLIPNDLHQWIPIGLGWIAKGISMKLAWKIQRVLSATTSAVAGGLMFSRALLRIVFRNRKENIEHTATMFDEALGLSVAGLGLYTQIGNGFDFTIPFPLNLVTWPFSLAENWIQWQITERNENMA